MARNYKGYHLGLRYFLTDVAHCARKARKRFVAQPDQRMLPGSSIPEPYAPIVGGYQLKTTRFKVKLRSYFFMSFMDELIF
jgi:hypothetical protein